MCVRKSFSLCLVVGQLLREEEVVVQLQATISPKCPNESHVAFAVPAFVPTHPVFIDSVMQFAANFLSGLIRCTLCTVKRSVIEQLSDRPETPVFDVLYPDLFHRSFLYKLLVSRRESSPRPPVYASASSYVCRRLSSKSLILANRNLGVEYVCPFSAVSDLRSR